LFSCEADLDIIDLIERDYNVGTSEAFEIGYRKYNIIIDDYKPENNSRNTLLPPTPPKETNQIKTQIEPKKDYTELFNEARQTWISQRSKVIYLLEELQPKPPRNLI